MLATQSIEARALQEGCRQACTIGLSINEDIKPRTKRRSRKGQVYIHSAKPPAEPLTRVRNHARNNAVTSPPPSRKPALRLCSCPPCQESHIVFLELDLFQIVVAGKAARVIGVGLVSRVERHVRS